MRYSKNSFIVIIFSVLCFMLSSTAYAKELPVLKNVEVAVDINYDGDDLYEYSYTVTNPEDNTGLIWSISLDVSTDEDRVKLSSRGLYVKQIYTYKNELWFKSFDDMVVHLGELLKEQMVPVGTDFPNNWRSGLSVDGEVAWGSRKKEYRIHPGQSQGGLYVISRGLPGIRDIIIKPKWTFMTEGSVTKEDIEYSRETKKKIAFYGKTIGPVAPLKAFKSIDFIDYLMDLKHKAEDYGWIRIEGAQGIIQSLDQKLENAKEKIERGDGIAAKNILEAFLKEVEAQGCDSQDCPSDKHLLPEAYALLKFNAEYLIDNL
ncbi:MAG: hypothetical protein KAR06_08910 [Deltaproteobacteria bacterium]|nr:hypothetical protein [Deltaproteobacteria bacterium]